MESKTVTPTSLKRLTQANVKPTASNNVVKPEKADLFSKMLEASTKGKRTGAKAIVQGTGAASVTNQAVKPGAEPDPIVKELIARAGRDKARAFIDMFMNLYLKEAPENDPPGHQVAKDVGRPTRPY